MSEPFLGQITMFAGNFAPRGWAFCDGQMIQISDNTALFSLLGTTYGGDGRTTFALPDLRARSPRHEGTGAGAGSVNLGQSGGNESTTLTEANLPSHSHTLQPRVSSAVGNETSPVGNIPARANDGESNFINPSATPTPAQELNADGGSTANAGSGTSFDNLPPYLGINFIIALEGIFPSRS